MVAWQSSKTAILHRPRLESRLGHVYGWYHSFYKVFTQELLYTPGSFKVGLIYRGAFNFKIISLLGFNRVLREKDSMTDSKVVTYVANLLQNENIKK